MKNGFKNTIDFNQNDFFMQRKKNNPFCFLIELKPENERCKIDNYSNDDAILFKNGNIGFDD